MNEALLPGSVDFGGDVVEVLISPATEGRQYWLDIWHYRELLLFLAWRDISVRYKQSILGIFWAALQPTLSMIVFSIFFGRLAGLENRTDGIPYPVYAMVAIVPWQLFSRALADGSISLASNRQIITKIYFPRLIIPSSAILAALVDFLIAFAVLLAMLVYYGVPIGWHVVLLPAFALLACMTSFAVVLWLSAANAIYRDVQYTLPFLIQLWLFVSPVAYPSSIVPQSWQFLYSLNPMVGVIDGFRWALLGSEPPGASIVISIVMVALLLLGGAFYFRRMEAYFADLI